MSQIGSQGKTGVQLVKEQTPKTTMGRLIISVTSQSNFVECGAGQVFRLLGRVASPALLPVVQVHYPRGRPITSVVGAVLYFAR